MNTSKARKRSSDPTENGKSTNVSNCRIWKSCRLVNIILHIIPRDQLFNSSFLFFLLYSFSTFLAHIQRIQSVLYAFLRIRKSMYENKPFPLGKMRGADKHLIDVSVLSANPKFACTGERIIQKTPRIWAGGNSARLFTNSLTASPLAFTASLPKRNGNSASYTG